MTRLLAALAGCFITTVVLAATITIPAHTVSCLEAAQTVSVPDTPPAIIPPPPIGGAVWVYNGTCSNLWPQDYSWGGAGIQYDDTSGKPIGTPCDIKVSITGAYGGWQPSQNPNTVIAVGAGHLEFDIKPASANANWQSQALKVGDQPIGLIVNLKSYCPQPVALQWMHCKIPTPAITGSLTSIFKFSIQDQTPNGNTVWYLNNVEFTP